MSLSFVILFLYGAHKMRRTKATLIYRRTNNLRAVQLLPGESTFESTVRYLGIEVDHALEISEQAELYCRQSLGGQRLAAFNNSSRSSGPVD